MPSHLEDGQPNHYRIRRLKDKLGTKGLPTGEIDLLGAEAVEIAPPPDGFKLMMEALEYSRVHNAVGSAGIQRRALREALAWAKSRRAFGHVLCDYPMVQDELLKMRVEFEAGTLLAFEAAITFDEVQQNRERRTWLRLTTALAKYLTAEYAITATRAALELVGGNGYTSDYPMARLLRDAQVLTVWEGPANIQALELLRLLNPRYRGWEQYQSRLRDISGRIPEALDKLRDGLEARMRGDAEAVAITLRDEQSAQRHARKLLHRLSQSLAFALLCEAAAQGDPLQAQSAWRYFETIEPPGFGAEDDKARRGVLELLEEEAVQASEEFLNVALTDSRVCGAASGGDFVPSHPRDIKNHKNIDPQYCPMESVRVPNQLVNLEREIEAARDDGQPLGPGALPPQAITFQESQDGIRERDSPYHGDAGNRHLVGGMNHLLRPVVLRVDMEKEEDVFRCLAEIDVAPPHGNERVRDDHRQASLERLEDGDGSEASPMRVPPRSLLPAYGGAAAHS